MKVGVVTSNYLLLWSVFSRPTNYRVYKVLPSKPSEVVHFLSLVDSNKVETSKLDPEEKL